jgi:archaellum biogenesis ATPase FlaH
MKNSIALNEFAIHKNNNLLSRNDIDSLLEKQTNSGVFSGAELYNRNIVELPKLLGDLIPRVGLMLLAGSSDTGKSIFARDLILSLVLNRSEFIGFPFAANLSHRAIIVCTEDDDLAISYLIRKQLQNEDEDLILQSLQNLYFLFDAENLIEQLNGILIDNQVDIIKIDTLGDLVNDIKDNGEVRQILGSMKRLAMTHQCLILLMHHTNKRTESLVPNKSNIQGAGGLEQKCRLVLELRNDILDPNLKHLSVLKGNYLGKEFKSSSFVLECDPESLTFSNTGLRVPFDELINAQTYRSNKDPKNILPEYTSIEKPVLKMILKPIFLKHEAGLLRSLLKLLLAEELKIHFQLENSPGVNKVSDIITLLQWDGILSNPEDMGLKGKAAIIHLNPDTELN